MRNDRLGGRQVFSKQFKTDLIDADGSRCAICMGEYEERYLQIDHRVPYEVAGDAPGERQLEEYMLLNGACNRAKSWSCEHCENWLKTKSPDICRTCYWAYPESYDHVAMRNIRRLDVEWSGDETKEFDKMKEQAESSATTMPEFVKAILRKLAD